MKTEYKTTITLTDKEVAQLLRKVLEVPENSVVTFKCTTVSDAMDRYSRQEFSSVDIVVTK